MSKDEKVRVYLDDKEVGRIFIGIVTEEWLLSADLCEYFPEFKDTYWPDKESAVKALKEATNTLQQNWRFK